MVAAGCYKPTVNESETIKAAKALWAVRGRGGGNSQSLGLVPDEIRSNWSGIGDFTLPPPGEVKRVRW